VRLTTPSFSCHRCPARVSLRNYLAYDPGQCDSAEVSAGASSPSGVDGMDRFQKRVPKQRSSLVMARSISDRPCLASPRKQDLNAFIMKAITKRKVHKKC